jgi:cell division septum initiation protein DivIVA
MSREKFLQVNINKLLSEKQDLKKKIDKLETQVKYLEQMASYKEDLKPKKVKKIKPEITN